MSYFTIGGPGKEHRTNTPSPTGRVRERSKGDATCPSTCKNPSCWHPSWLGVTTKDPESEWLAKDNLETNPITIKPETVSHVAEQFSWFPYSPALRQGALFQWSLLLCQRVCLLAFLSVSLSPLSGPGRGPPSCNRAETLNFSLGPSLHMALNPLLPQQPPAQYKIKWGTNWSLWC